MTSATPEPGAPTVGRPGGSAWRRRLRAVLPHLLTAALAVAVSVGVQVGLSRPEPQTVVAPTPPPPTVAPTPAPTVPAAPTAGTAPAPAADIIRQDLADLRAEDDRLWSAIYLARAISQVSDAESQMRVNELESVAQSLVAVDGSLELAYERADESIKGPIAALRRDAGAIRDDLYVRPEGMDARLAVLRQTILTLIGERH